MRKPILNKWEPCDERNCKTKTQRNRNKTQMLSRTITISMSNTRRRVVRKNAREKKSSNKLKMWERNGKQVLTCKSPSSAIPSRIGRDCRMVAMCRVCRHIAGGRLRRFNIHSHIHGYPRAAKASPSKPSCYLRTTYCMNIRQWDFFSCENEIAEITKNRKRGTKKASRKIKEVKKKPDE